ncbi:MAG: tRNA 2-thiouridine(34) synthase MnmA [Candidatus Pacebacteria bacterium]|nr:tRNA 2-thiouridine(34) synthase MnmA [Candidatus Paceibacterota bacterium]
MKNIWSIFKNTSRNKGKKVFVGMSGGVDSSVSAYLLKKAGYDVTGVFIEVWQPDWITCTWKEDRLDAMRVAAHLGISFTTLDLEKEYKEEVVDYMISEYRKGRTPNPDVMCNKYVKFGGFYNWAVGQGADFVATGHYAQSKEGNMYTARDASKDQTYFLWTVKDFSKILFPIGHLLKTEVRDIARKVNLPVAEKKDSQGLCFIGKIDFKEFLSHYITPTPGNVILNNEIVGTHDGIEYLTIGQRHGFTITKKTPNDVPLFIVEKTGNDVAVSPKEKTSTAITIEIANSNIKKDGTFMARARYRQPLFECTVEKNKVTFKEPQIVAEGQSIVAYDGNHCIGGGIIDKVL